MKMVTLATWRRRARKQAHEHGHDLAPFRTDIPEHHPLVQVADCRRCCLGVIASAEHGSEGICGAAIWCDCDPRLAARDDVREDQPRVNDFC